MLTEILIKPFIEDLECAGIEDTTPYEQGFMAGMAALSDILSENIDNQPQLFTYLGMAISEGMQWVESQVSESPEKEAVERLEKAFREFEKVFPDVHDQPQGACKGWLDLADKLAKEVEEEPRERQPTPSRDLQENDWDYIPVHDDLPASLIQKYSKKNVWFTTPDSPGPEKPGRAILDLSSNRLQIIETNGNQVKRPYYIQLR